MILSRHLGELAKMFACPICQARKETGLASATALFSQELGEGISRRERWLQSPSHGYCLSRHLIISSLFLWEAASLLLSQALSLHINFGISIFQNSSNSTFHKEVVLHSTYRLRLCSSHPNPSQTRKRGIEHGCIERPWSSTSTNSTPTAGDVHVEQEITAFIAHPPRTLPPSHAGRRGSTPPPSATCCACHSLTRRWLLQSVFRISNGARRRCPWQSITSARDCRVFHQVRSTPISKSTVISSWMKLSDIISQFDCHLVLALEAAYMISVDIPTLCVS